jgi:hypothetical protein
MGREEVANRTAAFIKNERKVSRINLFLEQWTAKKK